MRQVKGGCVSNSQYHHGNALEDQLAAANAWWRDAGVDQVFVDEPLQLLNDKQSGTPIQSPDAASSAERDAQEHAAKAAGLSQDQLPAQLDTFCNWWLSAENSMAGSAGPRIPPRGKTGAELMVLVPMPEESDVELLLQGVQGKLVDNILRALCIAREDAYFASAMPSHTTFADWNSLAQWGLGAVTRQHVALAAPKRLLVLGGQMAQLLDIDAKSITAQLTSGEKIIPALAARAPEHLIANARQRARLWGRLLEWTTPA